MSEKPTHEKHHEEDESASEKKDGLSWAKKLMTVGVGTFFLTEDALKSLVSEFKIPKELVGTLLDGAKGVRKEFMQNFITEVMGRVSDNVDPSTMIADFLRKNDVTFEIKIKVKDKE